MSCLCVLEPKMGGAIALVSQATHSIDIQYSTGKLVERDTDWIELGDVRGGSRLLESSDTSVLIRVDSLESLKLDFLEFPQNESEFDSSQPVLQKNRAKLSYQGIYRGQPVVLLQFFPSNPLVLQETITVRISWLEADEVAVESPSYFLRPRARDSIRKRTSKQFDEEMSPRIRLPITATGIYELSVQQVSEAAGVDIESLNPEGLGLEVGGVRIPLELEQNLPGVMSSSDSILFHGYQGNTEYTKTNVYWLDWTGTLPLRIEKRDGTPGDDSPTPMSFPTTSHAEEDSHIWQTMPRGDGLDHWFWGDKITAPGNRRFPVSVPFPAISDESIEIRVALHGLTFSSFNRPDHQSMLSLNGVFLGLHFWDDRRPTIQTQQFSSEILNLIDSEVLIEAPGLPGVVVDQFFVNWIELDYDRQYIAHENRLLFGAPTAGDFTFHIDGFGDEKLDVLDVSVPNQTLRFANYQVAKTERGQSLKFTTFAASDSRFLAQSVALREPVVEVSLDSASNWESPENGADYIIITHEEFESAAKRLASYRESQNMRTATVLIQDVYDEFGHGNFDPQAIRDFLAYAYHEWEKPSPSYVVLMGDAYLDYHDNLKTGSINYVPSQQINTDLIGLTVSDNWYAQVDGEDKIPDVFLGRIPVRLAVEAEQFVDRIIRYESGSSREDWRSRVAFVADDDNPEFEDLSDTLADYLPPSFTASKWYAGQRSEEKQSSGIVNLFESGHGLISYAGHGTIASWGLSGRGEILLTGNIAKNINPRGRWPIVTVANCLNGFFAARHSNPALAETLLTSQHGGAIAVWAPTSLGFPEGHRILMEHFYEQVFTKGETRIGAATTAAQIATFVQDPIWLELSETYVLFGDPAMKIGLSLPPKRPSLTIRPISNDKIELRYATEPGLSYTLFARATLGLEDEWGALPNAPHNSGSYSISIGGAQGARFFRLEVKSMSLSTDAKEKGASVPLSE